MQYVGKVGDYVYNQWNSLNPATLSGAIDIIVIEQPDGTMHCSPWHVRFGKFSIIKPAQKRIDLYVNDVKTDLPMKLGDGGEAFFVFETSSDQFLSKSVLTSPVASPSSSPEISPEGSPSSSDPTGLDLNVGTLDLNDPKVEDDLEEKIKLSASTPGSAPLSPAKSPTPTPSISAKLVFESARKVTQKLNIPSKIDNNGDMVLDMDGYKPNAPKNIENSDEMLRKIFMGELEKLGVQHDDESLFMLWDEIIKMDKDGKIRISNINDTELIEDVDLNDVLVVDEAPLPANDSANSEQTYFKTLRLTSEQLRLMNLKQGENKLTFKLNKGTSQIVSVLYLWKSSTPIVISDIDGTITKSDALGHVLNFIGRDWTHEGVARLFRDIHANGYNIIYLTARSVGQADSTRQYLHSIIQENGIRLPKGPVILSPDRTMAALKREVILKKPEVFKMSCLNDIKSLFYNNTNQEENNEDTRTPFYAGFGNRITDAISYRSVMIPSHRIFTINPNGEVHMELLELSGVKSSYITIGELVDQFFPPVAQLTSFSESQETAGPFSATNLSANYTIDEKFNDVNYWREPLYLSDLTDIEEDEPEQPKSPSILSIRSFTSDSEKPDKKVTATRERPSSISSFSPLKSFMTSRPSPQKTTPDEGNDYVEPEDEDDYTDDYEDDYEDDDYDEDEDDDYDDDEADDDEYDEEEDIDDLELDQDDLLDLSDGLPKSPESPKLSPVSKREPQAQPPRSPDIRASNSQTPPIITKASSLLE